MAQTHMISISKKTTEEVDWTTPIRNTIPQSYGESPDNCQLNALPSNSVVRTPSVVKGAT